MEPRVPDAGALEYLEALLVGTRELAAGDQTTF